MELRSIEAPPMRAAVTAPAEASVRFEDGSAGCVANIFRPRRGQLLLTLALDLSHTGAYLQPDEKIITKIEGGCQGFWCPFHCLPQTRSPCHAPIDCTTSQVCTLLPSRLSRSVAVADHEITYREHQTRVYRLASALAKHGINRGDRVGTFQVSCATGIPRPPRPLPRAVREAVSVPSHDPTLDDRVESHRHLLSSLP